MRFDASTYTIYTTIDIIHVVLASLNLILQCAFTFADWEFTEMNNSVYGNPSSLTIQNEKNIKTGECSKRISSFYIISSVHHRNFANYGIDSAISHFNVVMQSSPVTRAYTKSNKHLGYIWKKYFLLDLLLSLSIWEEHINHLDLSYTPKKKKKGKSNETENRI